GAVDPGIDGIADGDLAGDELAVVAVDVGLDLQGIVHPEERKAGAALGDLAAIADLAAGLGIEGRLVEHHDAALADAEALDRRSLAIQRRDARLRVQFLVTAKARRLATVVDGRAGPEAAGGPRLLALARHRRIEARRVDAHASLPADIGRQVQRKAIGIVPAERRLAVEAGAGAPAQRRDGGPEDLHAVRDGLEEALLFEPQH